MQREQQAVQDGHARLKTLHGVSPAGNPSMPCDQCAADDLILRVRLCLDRANMWALRDVNIRVDGDRVILAGKVGTFYQKQLATELTRRVAGVIGIDNLVEVTFYPFRPTAVSANLHGGS